MAASLLFVTQVAPYRDGPAGAHGVLDQATHGVAEAAELNGLSPRRVEDVRELALVSIHSATDSCYGWGDYGALVGARFDGHPWTQSFRIDVVDPEHPACAHLEREWEWRDEVYQFRDLRADAHILLRVRDGELDLEQPGARSPAFGYPLAWCFTEGRGRVFSTSLGHFPSAWESPVYLRHVSGGLGWTLGA